MPVIVSSIKDSFSFLALMLNILGDHSEKSIISYFYLLINTLILPSS